MCVPSATARCPYGLFNNLLGLLQFTKGASLGLIEHNPMTGSIGLVFALSGGCVVSPTTTPTHRALFRAFTQVTQVPGRIGVRRGAVCQHPVYSSSIIVKTQVSCGMLCQFNNQVMQDALGSDGDREVTLEELRKELASTVLTQTRRTGFGIFAAESIRKGDKVGTYGGIVLPNTSLCDGSNTLKLYAHEASR